mmetsp:Transcript_5272/g.11551  ORF Transcript_5272/g.11551 Transcript_5272/m.11551 type:complete len:392 (+) Transcript_5272:110-1285(+)|eukprot:CAMPEP_0202904936 /NCGR_PEP_ID=MMETSP1392-20130828/31831_1 /ASSEMBLY_ACC=CAM_ASM_000868 /TAXON_ID=225041 /ORGANISM="Chlamydomonas chlamydogama, Strain SAG 11-48b" /LENGTH=391 /DNA_ID=CAMNT_0049592819 /DNA_START=62 /DNA_END=1240 /DNA_ORIENTATION=+
MDTLAQADRAYVEEDYTRAVELYTEAIKVSPSSAQIYESRSNAHIKLENYLEAAEDASKALELSGGSSKAYFRKGVACFHLEEYETAKEAFEAGQQLDPSNAQYKTWLRKCQAELQDEQDTVRMSDKDAGASSGTAQAPQHAKPASSSSPSAAPATQTAAAPAASEQPAPSVASTTSAAPLAPSAAPAFEGKYRHQWYQLQNKVTVDVYAKNIAKEAVSCHFEQQHLNFAIKDAEGGEEYKLDVDLYGKIFPEQCKVEVLKTKIEVTMVKADNTQWGTLEKSNKVVAPNYSTPGTTVQGKYPTSYKKPKDWDKVETELSELEKKGDLDFGDPLNNFFKKIFSQGDEDQRRAMMKSFVESNGTVLSTNWDEVGQKKVECTPPDGMEVRSWNE